MSEPKDSGTSLPVDELKPGMRLSRDVVRDGVVLLAAGTELTSPLIRMFARWAIRNVEVVGTGRPEDEPTLDVRYSPEVALAAREHVARLFLHVPTESPGVACIRELAMVRLTDRLAHQARRRPAP